MGLKNLIRYTSNCLVQVLPWICFDFHKFSSCPDSGRRLQSTFRASGEAVRKLDCKNRLRRRPSHQFFFPRARGKTRGTLNPKRVQFWVVGVGLIPHGAVGPSTLSGEGPGAPAVDTPKSSRAHRAHYLGGRGPPSSASVLSPSSARRLSCGLAALLEVPLS